MRASNYSLTAGLILTLLCSSEARAQSLFARAMQTKSYRGLISDHTARARGDLLTIVIREEHKVDNEDKTNRSQSSTLAARLEAFNLDSGLFKGTLLPEFDVRANRTFAGQATQQKDGLLTARIAVTVQDVLPNGNLVVVGRRTIVVDDEEKTLMISGIVRRVDIATDNTIQSSLVAEAKVALIGKGKSTEAVTRGPIGQLIETAWWLIWPF